jgi:Zn-dependent protease
MIFNLIPIPPLDGSKILFAILPDRYDNFKETLERYGIFILFALLIFGAGFLNAIFNLMLKIIQIFI